MNTEQTSNSSEDEIDLKELIIPIWKARKQILMISLLCAFLGGVIGFLTPPTYTAGSTFLPQTAESGVGGNLGGLAALAGINLNAPSAGGDIPPSLYNRVLGSEAFRKRILDASIWINGDSLTYREYLVSRPETAIVNIKKYTIGLPGLILGSLNKSEVENLESQAGRLRPLSDQEHKLHQSLANKISINNDKKEGIVSLTVVEGDPLVAAQIAKVTESILQDWIIEHKAKNAKAQYDFIDKQFSAKQKEFYALQDQVSSFMDRNQNVSLAFYQNRLNRLQTEFALVSSVYSELAKQKEQAAIQLSKDTPTFSIIEPVKVPKEKTAPKKSLFILGGFFLGIIFGVVWFLVKNPFQIFLNEIVEIKS
jgi:uncharacterized protein involved in exopolysaccharide biosynthesis